MTNNSKLTKVLEHLTRGEDDIARDLLHTVFIEKARAIHEELMNADEEMHDNDSMDEMVHGSGDMGEDLTNEIEAMEDEIDFEETMEDEMMPGDEPMATDVPVDMPADDMESPVSIDSGEHGMDEVEDKMEELEAALSALRAEFDKLEQGASEEGDEEVEDLEMDSDSEEADVEDEEEVDGEEEVEGEEAEGEEEEKEEEEMDESWSLDEDFDDLAESLDLEVVEKDMEKAQKTAKDVGAASSGMSTGANAKSPLPKSQTSRMGAKPVERGAGGHTGYNLETAPKSAKLTGTEDNRRKKSTQGTSNMSSGKYGAKTVSGSKLETTASEFHADANKMSPLSKGGQNLK